MFRFPWGDMHSLNLGWFLQKFNELREDWATAEAGIDGALDAEIQRAEDALSDVFDARDAAAASATAAAGSASSAGTSATAAQNSATAAASSATLANQKATAAGLSEAAAGQSATAANNSATAAAGSATQAGNSATNAANSATAAGQEATNAAGSAAAASNSATAAAGSAAAAEASAVRAEEVEESIPEDYSTLSEDVNDLQTAVSALDASLASVENTRTASRAYNLGDLIVHQNRLYKVISPIASGGTLTIGTNIVATTMETEVLNSVSEVERGYSIGSESIDKILVPDFDDITASGRVFKKTKNKISIKRTTTSSSGLIISLSGDTERHVVGITTGYTPDINNLIPINKLNALKAIGFNKPEQSEYSAYLGIRTYNIVDSTITYINTFAIGLDSMIDTIKTTIPTAENATHFELVIYTRQTQGIPADYMEIICEFAEIPTT